MQLVSFVCNNPECLTDYRLVPDEDEQRYGELLLGGSFECPECKEAVLVLTLKVIDGYRTVKKITARNLWLAVNGMGMPEDRAFDHVDVIDMLVKNPVVYVSASMKKTGRVLINYLVLKNGKRLHFGDGAAIYKIEEDQDGRRSQRLQDEDGQSGTEEHPPGSEAAPSADVAED